ncbi:MAG: DUF5615 family PIN-like protein [Planctomycetes bacterium]|nr:DUF5615 family PIN-like protein [Planctomycetota bacterium]
MSAVKFLIDEDVAKYLGTALQRAESMVVVLRVVESGAPGSGTLDPPLLAWAQANGFAIVTKDKNTMPGHALEHVRTGNHTWGIFVLRTGFTVREIVDSLLLIYGASQAEEWRDQVNFIPFS